MTRHARGITLVELLTVMVVVAILAAIAVPSYRNYIIRAQRTDATTTLLNIAAAQEKFFLQYNRYTDNLILPPPDGLNMSAVTPDGRYDLDPNLTATGFEIHATPRAGGGQTTDQKCQQFQIDESGRKSATNGGGADNTSECWR